ncbi:ribonuclease H-like domain-containing protein [Brevibacillus sp. H7]|uniref:ribonuclease H-like domain-containing protein n=1 Tax=Brevibacillus sp. H7 TaxID=3349138 RepID=UPI00380AB026
MSLKDKLNRFKGHLTKEAPLPSPVPQTDIPYQEKWAILQAKPFVWNDDYVMVREVRYPLTQRHGAYRFAQLFDVMRAWEQSGISHPLSTAQRTAADLLFFDTETTGLHGGAGNTIFLLGHSRLDGDSVVVRQHFLAAPHAEITLYQSFLSEVTSSTHLVTFNGKAFDWPQVKTRHTLIRDSVPKLPPLGHYDLLHGARRLWKHDLESCRLSLIEREKLGVLRKNDVPGYMAPILYFDYLQNRDPETIQGVLHHNELDVLSLITLYIHLSKLLLTHEKEAVSCEEGFEIARWYEALGEDEMAYRGYLRIAESRHVLSAKAKIALGLLHKKRKQWEQALAIWEALIRESAYIPEEIYIEAAKIYEHQLKDYEKALHYTRRAFEEWKKKRTILRRTSKAEMSAYQKRLERLEKRITT